MIFSGPVVSNNKSWVIEAGIICHLSLSKHYNFDAWESHIWALKSKKQMPSCWRQGQSLH